MGRQMRKEIETMQQLEQIWRRRMMKWNWVGRWQRNGRWIRVAVDAYGMSSFSLYGFIILGSVYEQHI